MLFVTRLLCYISPNRIFCIIRVPELQELDRESPKRLTKLQLFNASIFLDPHSLRVLGKGVVVQC